MIHQETEQLREKYNPEGSELRKLQSIMFRILKIVTAICDEHNIPYWLSGGTLLGAVRHGGFIPWDDDIDIELLRSDYKKLLKLLPKELPADLYLQKPSEKGNRILFSKVRDRYSIIDAEEENNSSYKEKGLFIDIFPEEHSYPALKSFVDFFYGRAFRRIKRGKPFLSVQYFFEYSISLLILFPIGWVSKGVARLICAITKPPYILHSYGIGNTTNHKAEYMFPLSQVEFEGELFNSPKDKNAYLQAQYGDYMHIPSEDKRETHFMKVTYLKKS